jgi:hypothetical protein
MTRLCRWAKEFLSLQDSRMRWRGRLEGLVGVGTGVVGWGMVGNRFIG